MLALLALLPTASAFTFTQFYWSDSSFALQWWMDGLDSDGDGVAETADEEDSLPAGYSLEVIQKSWDNWETGAPCAGVTEAYQGLMVLEARDPQDGFITFLWDDPLDEQTAGVLGVTYSSGGGTETKTVEDQLLYQHVDVDIVFNDNVDFGSTQEIEAGQCNGQTSIEGVATHEIGHLYGMGHSCEQDDQCTDRLLKEATMFWSVSACDLESNDPNQDDVDGITALYGVYGTFVATTDRFGGAPLEVGFEVSSDAEVIDAHWEFGDGGSSDEYPETTHVYDSSGQFTVRVDLTLASDECGEVTYSQKKIGYVLSCLPPSPAEGTSGLFQIQPTNGLTWQTINHTDVTTYGCIDTIRWEVYEGSGDGAITPESMVDFDGDGAGDAIEAWSPEITFPAAGTYTVLMNVGGPGGIVAGSLTIEVTEQDGVGGCGCDVAGLGALGLASLAAAGLAAARRRR